jgi:hypothetical protein
MNGLASCCALVRQRPAQLICYGNDTLRENLARQSISWHASLSGGAIWGTFSVRTIAVSTSLLRLDAAPAEPLQSSRGDLDVDKVTLNVTDRTEPIEAFL